MPRIVHFEIPAADPDRAAEFYSKVFDWKIQKWEGPVDYWLATTGEEGSPGINGGLMRKGGPVEGIVNTLDVDDLDAYLARVDEAGGSLLVPKMAVPGVGWMAYCKDSEGNPFGMMQADPEAK